MSGDITGSTLGFPSLEVFLQIYVRALLSFDQLFQNIGLNSDRVNRRLYSFDHFLLLILLVFIKRIENQSRGHPLNLHLLVLFCHVTLPFRKEILL